MEWGTHTMGRLLRKSAGKKQEKSIIGKKEGKKCSCFCLNFPPLSFDSFLLPLYCILSYLQFPWVCIQVMLKALIFGEGHFLHPRQAPCQQWHSSNHCQVTPAQGKEVVFSFGIAQFSQPEKPIPSAGMWLITYLQFWIFPSSHLQLILRLSPTMNRGAIFRW